MATLFLDCLLRATLVAGGTAVILWAMRIKSAATRHTAWTAVVVVMLLLPIWSMAGLRLRVRILEPAPSSVLATPDASVGQIPVVPELNEATAVSLPATAPARRFDTLDILFGVYLLVAGVLLARLATGTVLALRLRRGAVVQSGIATSDRCTTPITIGWLRPVAMLPAAWPQWPEAQLRAVLTHEGEHVRRRDPLVQWLALLNRAVFWFHPVAWWLDRRLSALAEEACDAAVLAAGYSPEDYSGYLLELARSVAGQRHRVHIGMAMVGGGLTTRVRRILDGGSATRVSRTRVVLTISCCVLTSVVFAAATPTPGTPVADGRMGRMSPALARASKQAASKPTFDVVSVKPCDPKDGSGSRSGGAGGGSMSPGHLIGNCLTLYNIMQNAYIRFADGRGHNAWTIRETEIEGGPEWIKQDHFMIEATAGGPSSQVMMRGPMLQAALEDRFHLKLHRDTRQGPVYDLTVSASGSKLQPAKEGACVPQDWTVFPMPELPDGQHRCAVKGMMIDASGNRSTTMPSLEKPLYTMAWDNEAMSLDELASDFLHLDRPVVNKTGVPGRFNFHLTHTADLRDREPTGPSSDAHVAAVALKEQLGLDLKPSTGPRYFIVIDHVEHPTPNAPTREGVIR